MLTPKQIAKFWSHVRKGNMTCDCWLWRGAHSGKYGVFFVDKTQITAHRLAYELNIGPLDSKKYIQRTCGNIACVNPAHLKMTARRNASLTKKETQSEFYVRCRRYNEKFPFQMTERRDRALAEFQLTGI